MGLHKVQAHPGIQNGLRRFRCEEPAFLVQYPPATMAIKKWGTDLLFNDPHMLANSRPSQTQDLSSSFKAPFLGNSNDGDESFHR
jgi:hypothetical protein